MNVLNSVGVRELAGRCAECGHKILAQIDRARNAIQNEFRETLQAHDRLLRLALNEAEALAWQTDVPHLVFPTLAFEKAQSVAAWAEHQKLVRQSFGRQAA